MATSDADRDRRRRQRWQPRHNVVTKPPGETSLSVAPQRGQGWPPLRCTCRKSRTSTSKRGGTRSRRTRDGPGGHLARGPIEPLDLLFGRQGRALAEGRQAGLPEDLVAVAVADAGHEGLVLEQGP